MFWIIQAQFQYTQLIQTVQDFSLDFSFDLAVLKNSKSVVFLWNYFRVLSPLQFA